MINPGERRMPMSKHTKLAVGLAAVAFAAGTGKPALAQQPSQDVVGEIANNTGYFVDGKTFKIVKGTAKSDDAAARFASLQKMGAKEAGPGVMVFRYNDKLYIVENTPMASPQAMKSFQDNWNVSYMNAQKNFQDNWNVSYMKDNGTDIDPAYAQAMKNFQDNWNVSYMKAAKDFQDNWNVSYMKNFQDNWNVSYMKATKDFQDNWNTSYMK
jgi:hypothetical protein